MPIFFQKEIYFDRRISYLHGDYNIFSDFILLNDTFGKQYCRLQTKFVIDLLTCY